jgi:hypothetical protein
MMTEKIRSVWSVHAILGNMAVNSIPKLDKTAFSVTSLEKNDEDEKAYWLSKTPCDRLDAVETIVETMRQNLNG